MFSLSLLVSSFFYFFSTLIYICHLFLHFTLLYHSSLRLNSLTNADDDFTLFSPHHCSNIFYFSTIARISRTKRSKVLNASHNAIKFIDNTTFNDAGNLQFLDLSHNQLTNLQSRTFTRLQRLGSLMLNNNSIESISDDAFDGLNLSYLDLSCNKLRSGDFLWPSTVNVRFLNLTFNDFVEINVSVLENISVDLWGEFRWWVE